VHIRQLEDSGVDLYWLPLGAGGHSVRWNGRIFEALVARYERRSPLHLYHSALKVRVSGEKYVIEMGPEPSGSPSGRGGVSRGSVGARWLGRSRLFRYEVRCARDGVIPDIAEAFGPPQQVSSEADQANVLLDLVPKFPTATWGRDELGAGEMWNSNSLTAWLLARSGHDMGAINLPPGGRAPGWDAGLVVAARFAGQVTTAPSSLVPRGAAQESEPMPVLANRDNRYPKLRGDLLV
jgi:hypothetical protein